MTGMRHGLRRLLTTPAAVLRLCGVVVMATWVVGPTFVGAQGPAPTDVEVVGSVPSESEGALNAAADALVSAKVPTLLDTQVGGSFDNRQAFLEGDDDFVVSGVPFSPAETAELAKKGRAVVEAPFNAVGLAVFGFVPQLTSFPEGCEDDDTCTENLRIYDGPIRFSPEVLATAFFETRNPWKLAEFRSSVVLQSGRRIETPGAAPRPLVRTDPDATNLYLERYIELTQPTVRRQALTGLPGTSPDAATSETWSKPVTSARLGMDNTVSQIREGLDPAASTISFGGVLTVASPALVKESFDLNAARRESLRVPLFQVQLRNSAGEWVLPTTASISAAIAAGEGIPNTGSTDLKVPGAYPITWVNNLYAPRTGLSAEKANALAALVRSQATVGQRPAQLAARIDGRLTPKMVLRALAAADEIVASNCAAAKGTVARSSDAGGSAPKGGFPGLGAVTYCVPKAVSSAPTTTTTSTPPTTEAPTGEVAGGDQSLADPFLDTSAGFDQEPFDTGFVEDPGPSVLGAELTATGAAADGTGSPAPEAGVGGTVDGVGSTAALAAQRSMPLPIPGRSLPPLDRAATLGVGALAYVGVRRVKGRRS